MITILICSVFSIFAFYQFSRPFFLTLKAKKEWDASESFTVIDQSKRRIAIYAVIIVAAVACLIVSLYMASSWELWEAGVSVGILMTLTGISKLLATTVFHKIYYNDVHFIYINEMYRIKSYKGIQPVKRSRGRYQLLLYNGKSIELPRHLALSFKQVMGK